MPFTQEEVSSVKQNNTAQSLTSWQEKSKASGIEVTSFNFEENLEDPRVANMLRAIHSGIYSTTFPIPEEQEDVAVWIERGPKKGRNPKQFITAHFANFEQALDLSDQIAKAKESGNEEQAKELQKQFDALTIGFVVGEQYNQDSALINYVIRNKDFDGKTAGKPKFDGKEMVDHQVAQYRDHAKAKGGKLCFVGWEANNPEHTPFFDENGNPDFSVDVMDPERRVQVLCSPIFNKNLKEYFQQNFV